MSQLSTSASAYIYRLPHELIVSVCHHLSVHETLTILRSTCRQLCDAVTPACFQHSILRITEFHLDTLYRSSEATRLLLEQLPSLVIDVQDSKDEEASREATMYRTLALYALRSPRQPDLFIFPALQSLTVTAHSFPQTIQLSHHVGLSELCRSSPQSLQQLTSLDLAAVFIDIDDNEIFALIAAAAVNLRRLRVGQVYTARERMSSPVSVPPGLRGTGGFLPQLFLALGLLPRLTELDCPSLQPLLPAGSLAAAPLLQCLTTLKATVESTAAMQSLLRCLTGTSLSSTLRQLTLGSSAACRPKVLLTLFQLPSLQELDVQRLPIALDHLAEFCRAAPAIARLSPLIALHLPACARGGNEDVATVQYVAEHLSVFIDRLTTLRSLRYAPRYRRSRPWDAAVTSALINYAKTSGAGRLHSLELELKTDFPDEQGLAGLSLSSLIDFTLIAKSATVSEAQLTELLLAIPSVLRLRLEVHRRGFDAVTTIAQHCPALLELCLAGSLKRDASASQRGPASTAAVPSSFLPQLISLSIDDGVVKEDNEPRYGHAVRSTRHPNSPPPEAKAPDVPYDFAVVRHLTQPPCKSLQLVRLRGDRLTWAHIQSLSSLPSLSAVVCDLYDNAAQRQPPAGLIELVQALSPDNVDRVGLPPPPLEEIVDPAAFVSAMFARHKQLQYPAYPQLAALETARRRLRRRLQLSAVGTDTKATRVPLWPIPAYIASVVNADDAARPSQQQREMARLILDERRSLQGTHRMDAYALIGRRDVSVEMLRSVFFEELAAVPSRPDSEDEGEDESDESTRPPAHKVARVE